MLRRVLRRVARLVRPAPPAPPRPLATTPPPVSPAARKRRKLDRVRPLLRDDVPVIATPGHFDCLTPELRAQFGVADTDNVSAHEYDEIARGLIAKYAGGLILDCGAGLRPTYYDDVVNYEIVPYPTTDVLGVGERLPFRDGVFDAVFSLNVLEHVRDPFACAAEIARVMKPGGELYCVVPFLQALHGYPHHYYNMTHQGLKALFDRYLSVERQEVSPSGLPIWTLTHTLHRWASVLSEPTRTAFLKMRVADLIGDPAQYLTLPAVTEVPAEVNFELASTTTLFARKAA